jgi:hypothetical protein
VFLLIVIILNKKIFKNSPEQSILMSILELDVNYNALLIVKLRIQQSLVPVHKFMRRIDMLPDVFTNYFTDKKSIHS